MSNERAAELETLAAIYGDKLTINSSCSGRISIPVALQQSVQLLCSSMGCAEGNEQHVANLPLVHVYFELTKNYPYDAAPTVEVKTSWLPDEVAQKLEQKAKSLWENYGRTQVMYAYISDLEEAAEYAFRISHLEIEEDILQQLLEYDRSAKWQAFEQCTLECGICLDPKKGNICHQLEDCKHVFCIQCLQEYYNNAILTGNISDVKCPAFDCGDKRTQRATCITPRELLRIPIERPAVQRYVTLKRKKKLESDRTTIWCPRQWCQGAVKGNNYPWPAIALDDMGTIFEDQISFGYISPETDEDQEQDEAAKEIILLASRL